MKPERKKRNTVWLELQRYHVVPLKPRLAEHVMELERAIRQGVLAYPDVARKDFFDVELENGWAYIHVHADARTVYLVVHSVSRLMSSFSNGNGSGDDQDGTDEDEPNESIALKMSSAVQFEARGSSGRLHRGELDLLAVILGRTLQDEPNLTYLMPDERVRRTVLRWFFRSLAIRASRICGEIYTTDTIEGGALWISPGRTHTFGRVVRMGILTAPFRLGCAGLRRCWRLRARLDEVHKRLASGPHWYLMALGVDSPDRRDVIRGALIDPVLTRADSDGLPCYLETFNPANLPFYKKRGFRIEGAGRIPGGGPNFWALVRAPQ